MLLTSKTYNDTYFTNQFIAQTGAVTLQDLNAMESYFLRMIDWKLHITPEEFDYYDKSLHKVFLQTQAQSRPAHCLPQGPSLIPTAQPQPSSTLTFNELHPLERQLALQ